MEEKIGKKQKKKKYILLRRYVILMCKMVKWNFGMLGVL